MDISAETESIQEFIDKGNFHAAMNLTISAMNECRRDNDPAGTDHFLALIQRITDTMTARFGSRVNKT